MVWKNFLKENIFTVSTMVEDYDNPQSHWGLRQILPDCRAHAMPCDFWIAQKIYPYILKIVFCVFITKIFILIYGKVLYSLLYLLAYSYISKYTTHWWEAIISERYFEDDIYLISLNIYILKIILLKMYKNFKSINAWINFSAFL